MKQKSLLFAGMLLALGSSDSFSQSFMKRLNERAQEAARNATENAVQRNVERKVEDGVDKAFDGNSYKGKGKSKKEKKENSNEEAENESSQSSSNNDNSSAKGGNTQKATEMAYAKCDFVRGDEVVFDDQLTGEQLGEFPSQWDLLSGSSEIAKINGENVIKALNPGDRIAPLFKDMKSYLPEKFTVEFDFWVDKSESLRTNAYQIEFQDKEKNMTQNINFNVSDGETGELKWYYAVGSGGEREQRDGGDDNVAIQRSAWNHLAISFNKRAMKIYVNGTRIANIPNTYKPDNFHVSFDCWGGWTMNNSAMKNIVVAKGAVPLYDRMMNEGKFITYGITFDVNKAAIKPESMGEINRIVSLMNENPTLKFSVEGHTDATGNAANNQKLSEQRAQAIVDKLVELGIKKDRLSAVGKGQTSPLADNGTEEGRAKNRRVEFVKK